jgi:hypothetical protein
VPFQLVEEVRELDHLQGKSASVLARQAPHVGAPARFVLVIDHRQDRIAGIDDREALVVLDELSSATIVR